MGGEPTKGAERLLASSICTERAAGNNLWSKLGRATGKGGVLELGTAASSGHGEVATNLGLGL